MLLSPPSSSLVIPTQTRTTMKKKRASSNADNSMALSLHVVDLEHGEHPAPLEVYYPTAIESSSKSIRRSSRFITNKYRSESPERSSGKKLSALSLSTSRIPKSTLRKSPRFSPVEIEDKGAKLGEKGGQFLVGSKKRSGSALPGSQNRSSFKKVKVGLGEEWFDGKCLRRSPRLHNDLVGAKNGNSKSVLLALPDPVSSRKSASRKRNLSEKCLRKSPRLNPSLGVAKDGNSKRELLALSEPVSSEKSASRKRNSREKCLRKSPRLNPGWRGDKSENSSSELLASRAPAELEKRDSHNYVLNEKSLKSRTIQMHVGKEKERMVKSDLKKIACVRERELGTVGKKSLRSRNTEFELPDASPKSTPAGSEVTNVSEKCLRSRKIEFELPDASPKSTPAGSKVTNVSEKCLRSRKIEFELPAASAGSALKESTYAVSDVRNVAEKGLKARKIDFKIPAALEGSTSMRCEIRNAGGKCLRSRKIDVKLPDASHNSASKKSTSEGSDINNVAEKHTKSRKIEFELPVTSSKGTSAGSDKTNVAEKCSRSRKIDFQSPDALGENNIQINTFEESDLNLKQNCLTPENMELNLPEERRVRKCESDVLSERCLRSRKIVFKIVAGENIEQKPPLINGEICKGGESATKNKKSNGKDVKHKNVSFFFGKPIPEEEAQKRWHWRYELKNSRSKHKNWVLNAGEEDETILNVQFHFAQAEVDGCVFNIGDCALIKGEGRKKHIGRILEFFKTMEGEDYFRVQWFYRAEDTVMQEAAAFHDKRRVFYSTLENDNPLDCIISKVNIVKRPPLVGLKPDRDQANFYYDMEYCVEYSTFHNLQTDNTSVSHYSPSNQCFDALDAPCTATPSEVFSSCGSFNRELALLDLYSGCGGMSTGLCFGAKLASINLVTKWTVDLEKSACDSVKLNHPETQVRNESAEDFLELLKRWKELCKGYVFNDLETTIEARLDTAEASGSNESSTSDSDQEYEVSCLIDIRYGDPNETGKDGLHFKVRWKGYGPKEDTWENIEGLSNCQEKIQDFVRNGLRSKILPLPGDVDVLCGGPPCQGISGYNRYRNANAPLTDEKNHQIVVFMDIVEFLKPKYVLMENVSDILRFDGASLGRYALSRLVHMKYQARLGTIAAGCYGLPQFRLRVFIWGGVSSEKLPPFPLPTHDVVVRHWPPPEFERNTVAYDEGQPRKIEDAVILRDAISDLPAVANGETRDMMAYSMPPKTEFQKYIRLTREEMMGFTSVHSSKTKEQVLYDHRPYPLSEDNYLRVSHIPHRKGASFRDLPGVVVGEDNVVHRDTMPALLPSGEPIAPDCVFTFEKGKSKRPFARLWWDETVPTVLTFPYFLSQAILHPEQDRVLTVRECARLQGFPDFYRFCGTVKERYSQVGNAVAIPVGKALGYALGMAFQKLVDDEPLMTLPPNFTFQRPFSVKLLL